MAILKPQGSVPQFMRNADPEVANFIETTNVPGAAFALYSLLKSKAEKNPYFHFPFEIQRANDNLKNNFEQIKSNPVEWVSKNIPSTAAYGTPGSFFFTGSALQDRDIASALGKSQVEYLVNNNFDLNKLQGDTKNLAFKYKLSKQILDQGLTGKWTGEGFGTPQANADAMASTLMSAGITDIKQFGQLPDGSYGNKQTGQPITTDYNRAGGQIFSGTYTGKDSTGFGVQFGPDGTPYFYTQQGASTSNMGDIVPVLAIVGSFIAPGIGSILTQTAATTVASQVVGAAVVGGLMAEAQGGDFLEGAIKSAVTAGVAPVVASNVGETVAGLMSDSAFKDVVSNAVASSAASAVTAALTDGDVGQAALQGALGGAGGSLGRDVAGALGVEGATGAALGGAAGAIAGGVDPITAISRAIGKIPGEKGAETAPETPVSAPTEAPVTDTGVMGGIAETIPEIPPPSTQEIPIPDQISQVLPGIQEGIAETIPPQDQQIIDLITEPEIPVAELPEVVITAPREEPIPGIQEGIAEGIPELTQEEIPPYDPATAQVMEEVVITTPREEPIPGIQEGMAETIPEDFGVQEGIAGTIPEDFGVQEGIAGTIPQDFGIQEGIAGTIPEDFGVQEGIAGTIPEEIPGIQEGMAEGIPEEIPGIQEGIAEGIPETTPFVSDYYISGGYQPRRRSMGPTVTTLGQALAPPLFPTSPVSGLTSYRGAGEIEGQQTGKQRRNVWNEASLRLKDALGL